MAGKDGDRKQPVTTKEIEYYSDGSVWKTTDQIDNVNHGQSTVYYPNGRVQAMAHYINGLMHGAYILLYENGSVWVESNYVDGLENGECKIYYKNGRLKTVSHYQSGVLDGLQISYYQDGTVKERSFYKRNQPAEEHYTFYSNGILNTATWYKNEGQETLFISFHPNGEVMKMYRYDEETGKLNNKIMFTEDGNLFLWTLLHPKSQGEAILHLNAQDLKEFMG